MRAFRQANLVFISVALIFASVCEASADQRTIDRIELMPRKPSPFVMKDWKARAQAYDRFIFDFNASDEYLPVRW